MRLFTAIDVDRATRAQLVALIGTLTVALEPVERLRWSPPENLHITTKFIGEWPADRLAPLRECMPTNLPEPEICVEGVGFFPSEHSPRVLFARVEPSLHLEALAGATDRALLPLGIPVETHPYQPHVTLARIPGRITGLSERLAEFGPTRFGAFRASEFSLYESRGGRYTKLESFPLQAPAR